MYFVYILYSRQADRYYVGQSDNPQERLIAHNSGISRYTSIASDWTIVHLEEFQTRTEAIQRERAIKKRKSRKYIESLFHN
ncbi:MAG: GIY-YIG nuclease family protein [Flavobacteriales bacterium]|nr:GIY-YIG nuclease family protein [Flavobacteriales bacterium]